MAGPNATERVAKFVAATRFEDLPDDVVHQVRRCAVDCLAVSLGGVGHPSLAKYLAVTDLLGGNEQARIWGTRRQANVATAALINGHLAHVLDFDDSYMPEVTILHGNAPVMPAAVAIAELQGAGGRDFTLAFALGFEIAARAALAAGKTLYDHHFHVTAIMGPVGAAVAAGKLLGLDAQHLVWAMGIACSSAGGLGQVHGSMTKAFHAGRGAMSGVLAALLAHQGFTSGGDPLAGHNSLLTLFPSDQHFEALTGDLFSRWELRRAAFKAYACGIVQQPVLDGVLALREGGLKPEDVEAIEARVNPAVGSATGKREPRDGLEGKFSVFHSAAVALIDGGAGPEQYTDARVQDSAVQRLRSRVSIDVDPAVHKDECFLRVRTRDGRVLDRHVEHASGTAENPLSDQQLEGKFRLLVEPVLGAIGAGRVLDALAHLPDLPRMSQLTKLLIP